MKISRENDVMVSEYCLAQSKGLVNVSWGQRSVMGRAMVVAIVVVGMVLTVLMKFWASDWIVVMQKFIKGRKEKHIRGSYHSLCDKGNCKGTSH